MCDGVQLLSLGYCLYLQEENLEPHHIPQIHIEQLIVKLHELLIDWLEVACVTRRTDLDEIFIYLGGEVASAQFGWNMSNVDIASALM